MSLSNAQIRKAMLGPVRRHPAIRCEATSCEKDGRSRYYHLGFHRRDNRDQHDWRVTHLGCARSIISAMAADFALCDCED